MLNYLYTMHLNYILHTTLLSCNSFSAFTRLSVTWAWHMWLAAFIQNAKSPFHLFPTPAVHSVLYTVKSLYPGVGDTCTQITGLASDITFQHDIASTRRRWQSLSPRLWRYYFIPASLITSNSLVHFNLAFCVCPPVPNCEMR